MSQVATLANFYLTTWEEWHTGTLYLSAFSGPVEGILLVIGVFVISAIYGPGFWDQGVLTVTRLEHLEFVRNLRIKNLPLNECFLLFGAAGLLANIVASYSNVLSARKKAKKPTVRPLLGLLPFALHTSLNLLWLYSSPTLLRAHLVPFMVYWGFSFAYSVGLIIVSHVLQAPELYPWWHALMIWSVFGCADAWAGWWSGGKWGLQGTEKGTIVFVWASLGMALAVYAYFVMDIILDVCSYCDINCLTIKRKPGVENGNSSGSNVYAMSNGPTTRRRK